MRGICISTPARCCLILFCIFAGISWPASTTGFYFDGTILCLMLAGWLTYTVALALEMGMTAATSYRIYDDVTTSAARFFLPSKMDAEPDDVVVEDLGIDSAGNDERWRLPDDDSGFNEFSEMTASMAHVSSVVTLSFSLHGIALLLAVLRLLYSFTFQPRFGIITDALLLSAPGLCHLLVVTSVVLILLISLAHLVMGDLWWELSTMSGSLHFAYIFLLTGGGELGDMKTAVAPFYHGLERNTVSLVVGYIAYAALPLFVGFILMQFMMAVIFINYYEIKHYANEPPSMFVEAGEIVRGRKRLRLLGFEAVGMARQAQTSPLDAPPTAGSNCGKGRDARGRRMPKKAKKPRMLRDKLMLANLAQAIEVLTLQGIPSVLKKKRLRLTSYARLLEFVAQNEILLSDVTMMVEEVDNMVEVLETAIHNPRTLVTAALKRMAAISKPWIPRMMTRFDVLPPDEQRERDRREAIAEELARYRQRMIFKLSTASPHDLFDELCDISSGEGAVTVHRPITPYTLEASLKIDHDGRAASSQKAKAQKFGLDALQQWRQKRAAEVASAKTGGLGVVAPALDPVEEGASPSTLQKILGPFRRNQVRASPQSLTRSADALISIAEKPAAPAGSKRRLLGQAMMQAARLEGTDRQPQESPQPQWSATAGQHFKDNYRRGLGKAMMQAARLEAAKEKPPGSPSLEQKANASRRRQQTIAQMEAARLEAATEEPGGKLPGTFQADNEANASKRRQLGADMKQTRFSTGGGSSSGSLPSVSQQLGSQEILPSYSPSNGSTEGLMNSRENLTNSMGSLTSSVKELLSPAKQPGQKPAALSSHRSSDSRVIIPSVKSEGRKGKIGTRRGSAQSVYTSGGESMIPLQWDALTGGSNAALSTKQPYSSTPSTTEVPVTRGRSSSITMSRTSSATQHKTSQVVPDARSSGGAKAPLIPNLKTTKRSSRLSVPGKAVEDLEAEVLQSNLSSDKSPHQTNRPVTPLMMLEGALANNSPKPKPAEITDTAPFLEYPDS